MTPEVEIEQTELTREITELTTTPAITTVAEFEKAGEQLVEMATARKKWMEFWAPVVDKNKAAVKAAKTAYDTACETRDLPLARLDIARALLEKAMNEFKNSQQRAQVELDKQQAEAARKVIVTMRESAQALAHEGRIAEAAATLKQASLIPTVRGQHRPPKLKGVAEVDEIDIEITDLEAFLEDVVVHKKLPLKGFVLRKEVGLLEIRESLIREFYFTMGPTFQVRGIKITPRTSFRPRAKKE